MSTISNTPFDTVYRAYNSERRERRGDTYIRADAHDIYNVKFEGGLGNESTGFIFRDIYTYIADYTNYTSQNPLVRTLYTYSNGVRVVEESGIDYDSDTDKYYWGHNVYLLDKDGEWINVDGYVHAEISGYPGAPFNGMYEIDSSTINDFKVFYNIGTYEYMGDEDRNAYSMRPLGRTFIEKPVNTPHERPTLKGNLAEDYVFTYYYMPTASGELLTRQQVDLFRECIESNGDGTPITPELPSEDTSEPGGGDETLPDYNPFSDPIGFPSLPTGGSSIATGMVRVYAPTSAQLQNLAGVLWSDDFVNTIKKVQNDPFEAIISLHSLPFSIAGSSATCRIGNFDTGLTMPAVNTQYMRINMGSITIPEHWGSALDYSPYVTVDIYLPYIGVRSLQVDDIIGKTISIYYNVDILTGACVASIMCGSSVLYTFNTNLLTSHPISGSSFASLYQSIINGMGNVLSGMVSGGIGGAVGGALGSAINTALSKHSSVSRGGSIGGNSGCLGNFTPYLIIHRPIQSLASGFAHFKGYPSNITTTLSSVSGYTEVESIHLNGITATDSEKAEIEALLYNGVLL